MKTARIAVLGVAVAAGLGAAILAGGSKPPEKTAARATAAAGRDRRRAGRRQGSELWRHRRRRGSTLGKLAEGPYPGRPRPQKRFAQWRQGTKRRDCALQFCGGEPLRRERLVMGPHSGFLAAVLPSGSRAVAINIDAQGSSTAGGFILPNDKVDVIHIFHDEDAARKGINNSFVSQIILTNVRVLAIGQNFQEKNGERVITEANATLELTPAQAETIVLAQRVRPAVADLAQHDRCERGQRSASYPQRFHGGPQRRGNSRQGALSAWFRVNGYRSRETGNEYL